MPMRVEYASSVAPTSVAPVQTLRDRGSHDFDVYPPAFTERHVVLGDLVVLRHVGIEVLLSMEEAVGGDLAVRCQPSEHREIDGSLVRHRQGTGHSQTHRTHPSVGLATEGDLTAAEHLRAARGELGVYLEADDGLPALEDLLET